MSVSVPLRLPCLFVLSSSSGETRFASKAKPLFHITSNTLHQHADSSKLPSVYYHVARTLLALFQGSNMRELAVIILVNLLNRPNFRDIAIKVKEELSSQSSLDKTIVDNIAAFVSHHKSTGSNRKEVQDAFDAVATAVSFDSPTKVLPLAKRVGMTHEKITSSMQYSRLMLINNKLFSPHQRQIRSDCIRDKAHVCVVEWCHDEGSKVNTFNSQPKMVWDAETGEKKPHERRVYNEHNLPRNYQLFLESDTYRKWQSMNESKTIGLEMFRQSRCPCVSIPKAHSCVDISM
jgi:hypothetical protein